MKFQNYITSIGTITSLMVVVVVQSTEMFRKYPYCTGSESNYSTSDDDYILMENEKLKIVTGVLLSHLKKSII